MTDKEKVTTALAICTGKCKCFGCWYGQNNSDFRCQERLMADALALLQEQEPVSVVEEWAWYDCYKCGACDKLFGKKNEIERWNFCPWCGRKVKWDV